MRIHSFFWALFVLVIILYSGFYFYIWLETCHFLNVFSVSTQSVSELRITLDHWKQTPVDHKNLLHYGRITSVWIDFIWIIAYVAVLIMLSYNAMQRERRPFLNNLLRLNMLLAVIAGVFDVLEDGILLYDMHGYGTQKHLFSSACFAWPKWIILAYIVAIYLFSLISRGFAKQKYYCES